MIHFVSRSRNCSCYFLLKNSHSEKAPSWKLRGVFVWKRKHRRAWRVTSWRSLWPSCEIVKCAFSILHSAFPLSSVCLPAMPLLCIALLCPLAIPSLSASQLYLLAVRSNPSDSAASAFLPLPRCMALFPPFRVFGTFSLSIFPSFSLSFFQACDFTILLTTAHSRLFLFPKRFYILVGIYWFARSAFHALFIPVDWLFSNFQFASSSRQWAFYIHPQVACPCPLIPYISPPSLSFHSLSFHFTISVLLWFPAQKR